MPYSGRLMGLHRTAESSAGLSPPKAAMNTGACCQHAPPLVVSKPLSSEGGFFNARLTFPKDYPNSPPSCRFMSEMWHPNGARTLHARGPCMHCLRHACTGSTC